MTVAEEKPPVDKYFDSDGVRIRYVEAGEGAPIILLHGGGSSLEGWNKAGTLQFLAQKHRVIAMDLRGHGKSDKPHGKIHYGVEMGKDVIRLLDHLEISKAHIAGYSRGAKIVARVVVHYPNRFLTATLGGGEPMLKPRQVKASLEDLAKRYENRPQRPRPNLPPNDPIAMASVLLGNGDFLVTKDQLRSIDIPVLGIVGSKDEPERFTQFEGIIPSLELVVIEGATHSGETGAMERPELQQAMQQFLAKHSSSN